METLEKKELEMVVEFRERMKDVLPPEMDKDESIYYRFLKARDFDIDKAEIMLRKSIIFRKARRINTILEDFKPKEAYTKYIQGTYLGEDKDGHPIRYVPSGKADFKGVLKSFTFNDYFQHCFWLTESERVCVQEANKKTGKNVWQGATILDLDKCELSNVCHPSIVPYLRRILVAFQDNYPETLRYAFIINTPKFFLLLYNILQNFMAPELIRKIRMYGRDGWKEELLKVMDKDILPGFLGGSRTDPDGNPMCYTFVCHGGKIPPELFLSEKDMSFTDKSSIKCITVEPKKSQRIFVEVNKCGSVIYWEFDVEKDIGFELSFKESEHKFKEILPVWRYEPLRGIVKDSYKCQWTGVYVITFDNTYSWLNKKEVSYCVSVVEPEQ